MNNRKEIICIKMPHQNEINSVSVKKKMRDFFSFSGFTASPSWSNMGENMVNHKDNTLKGFIQLNTLLDEMISTVSGIYAKTINIVSSNLNCLKGVFSNKSLHGILTLKTGLNKFNFNVGIMKKIRCRTNTSRKGCKTSLFNVCSKFANHSII